jgi:hypothetical protein
MATSFSAPKAKNFPIRPRSPWLAGLMQSCAFILLVNWRLQGVRGMDRKELAFRVSAELLLAGLLAAATGPTSTCASSSRPGSGTGCGSTCSCSACGPGHSGP